PDWRAASASPAMSTCESKRSKPALPSSTSRRCATGASSPRRHGNRIHTFIAPSLRFCGKGNMSQRSTTSAFVLVLAVFATPLCSQAPATLTIELGKQKAAVSPTLYGLMTEEINYSYDGGLYAELIRNRTFRSDWTGILNWYLVQKGASSA